MGKDILNDAVLLLDKHEGITSYDAVEEVKRISGIRKIGHSGTIDKFASGLLVLCTGRATKLTRYFLDGNKRYRGVIRLGIRTDTCDSEGTVISRIPCPPLDSSRLAGLVGRFMGAQFQVPPVYSALKIDGRRASDRARAGEQVELQPRRVVIKELAVVEHDPEAGTLTVDVLCSKGTYIRALARDIGDELGCGAHLTGLRRTASGHFRVEDAIGIDELREFVRTGRSKGAFVRGPLESLGFMKRIVVKEEAVPKILNGVRFVKEDILAVETEGEEPFIILDGSQNLIAIAGVDIDNWSVSYLNVFSS
ncbi:MAG TPA: tRNA pseudouridine(55) synthase TruB [Spirochaetes bacterium]|nr:tRNA pseudouridine(55) synthase TruB [Spirochaetota bacterium]